MRILYITNCYSKPDAPNVGAAARHYYTIERFLTEGFKVDCITSESSTIDQSTSCSIEPISKDSKVSCDFNLYKISSRKMKKSTFLSRLLYYVSFFINGFMKLRKLNTDYEYIIASVPTVFIGYLGLYKKGISKSKLILDVRDLWTDSLKGSKYGNNKILVFISYLMESYLYKKADLIICTTSSQANIVRTMTKNKVPVDVVMNGFDLELLDDKKYETDIPDIILRIRNKYKYIVLFTGKHSEYTDLDNLLNSSKFLDDDYAFLLVGGGYLKNSLLRRVEDENIKNVYFHEPVSKEKILNFMHNSDILMISYSDSDAWSKVIPNKLFDYLYWNKIVIATVCEGEITKNLQLADSNNIIIPPAQPQLLAENINKLKVFDAKNNRNYLMKKLTRTVQLDKFVFLIKEI